MKQILQGDFSLKTSFCQNLLFWWTWRKPSERLKIPVSSWWFFSIFQWNPSYTGRYFLSPCCRAVKSHRLKVFWFYVRGSLLTNVQSLLAPWFQDAVMAPLISSPCVATPSHQVLCRRVFQLWLHLKKRVLANFEPWFALSVVISPKT